MGALTMSGLRLTICTLLAATCLAPVGDLAQAQINITSCLASQDVVCVDTLNTRLMEIENAMQDPEVEAVAKLGRITALASLRRLDLAEAAIDSIPDSVNNQVLKDSAIVATISVPVQDPVRRGRQLLSRIASREYYDTARAAYIINLLQTSDLDTALQELVATNYPGEPMRYVSVNQLSRALVFQGRLEEALELVRNSCRGDENQESMLLESLVVAMASRGQVADATKLLGHIKAPFWEVMAKSQIAAELSKNGNMADAEELFDQARRNLSVFDQPEDRFRMFKSFVRSAIAGGRLDLALTAVDDVSIFPSDRADALHLILDIGAGKLDQAEWRPIADEITSLRAGRPNNVMISTGNGKNDWRRLAVTVTVSGDSKLATSLVRRIPDKETQQAALYDMAIILIHNMRFQEAVGVLSLQSNRDRQAQGYIRLSQIADQYGQDAIAEKAIQTATGLIEGPDFLPVSDSTVSMLAKYESRTGQYESAEMRLRNVKDKEMQAGVRIANFGFVAMHGSQDDYDTYLKIARKSVDAAGSEQMKSRLLRKLASHLAYAGRSEPILDLAKTIEEGPERDGFLMSMMDVLSNYQHFVPAKKLVSEISNPAMRAVEEHRLLLAVLRTLPSN